jgi:hypothetical protein
MRSLISVLFLVLLTAPATAGGQLGQLLSADDKTRLAALDDTLSDALYEAEQGSTADKMLLHKVLDGKPLPLVEQFDPRGKWRCRVIKVGGILPLVVYPNFSCAIAEDDAGLTFQKLTGSQRTEGHLYAESATRLIYAGAGYVDGETPRRYGDDPQQDQVAVVERRAASRIVLLFPAPHFESKLDVMVLER